MLKAELTCFLFPTNVPTVCRHLSLFYISGISPTPVNGLALHAHPFFLPVGFLSDRIMKISYQIIYQFLFFFSISVFLSDQSVKKKLSVDYLSDQIGEK